MPGFCSLCRQEILPGEQHGEYQTAHANCVDELMWERSREEEPGNMPEPENCATTDEF